MPDRQNVKKSLKLIEYVKTWQLLVVLILALFLSATFLRLNNTGMISRRNAIESADKSGDAQGVLTRMYDLQRYSSSHMNADTGIFYLQAQYDRDVRKAVAEASGGNSTGDNSPQARADAVCNPNLQIHGYSLAYQNCMVEQLSKEGQVLDPTSVNMPNPTLYRYSFVSPIWSADFAGLSVLVVVFIALVIILRLAIWITLRLILKIRFKQI